MANSFNLEKAFKDMHDDWFLMDSHVEEFVMLILYDTENDMTIGCTNYVLNKKSIHRDYAKDYVQDYQNKFDDLYEEQTGHENSQYQFKLVPVGITSDTLKYNS